jgi:hypothetical protein
MERKDSKDLNVDIAKATDEQYYRHVSARGQRDFFAREACRLRHKKEMKTLERLSRKIEEWIAEK